MNLDEVKVNLSLDRDEEKNETKITRQLEFTGNLTVQERTRLLEIANKCPIHKIMTSPINIATSMIES